MTVAVLTGTGYHGDMGKFWTEDRMRAKDAADLLGVPVHRVYLLVNKGRLERQFDEGYELGYYRRDHVLKLKEELAREREEKLKRRKNLRPVRE